MQQFRLYMKLKTKKRFYPVDWRNGVQVKNLIHATIFNAEEGQRALEEGIKLNDNMDFELREIK